MEMKKEVVKVEKLDQNDEKIYNLSKNDAVELLKSENVTESEQMLNKWCRDGDIDAVRVYKGAPAIRGLRISERSLRAFIFKKQGKVEDLMEIIEEKDVEIDSLKQQLKDLRKELRELKKSGIVVKKEKGIILENFTLTDDTLESTFKFKRATHQAFYDGETGVYSVMKSTRGKGQEEVFLKLTEEEKQVINQTRLDKLKS